MIRIGVIGYGYWGPKLVRNFMAAPGCRVTAVADLNAERLAHAQAGCPSLLVTQNPHEILANPDVDAVALVTPVASHYALALEALRAGKHVLVEKPLTATAEQAERLIDEANRRDLVLMVDHTFVYTGAVRLIRDLVRNSTFGHVCYFDSARVNIGMSQPDVSVLWDLAVHDLSIINCVLPAEPCAVSATGMSHIPGRPEDVAHMTLFLESGQIAHLHVNWLAPLKVRRTLIGGTNQIVVYDDLEPIEKVRVYDKVSPRAQEDRPGDRIISHRLGDFRAPSFDGTEALQTMARHFLECIDARTLPETDGRAGLRVVRILEAAELSLRDRGRPVTVRRA